MPQRSRPARALPRMLALASVALAASCGGQCGSCGSGGSDTSAPEGVENPRMAARINEVVELSVPGNDDIRGLSGLTVDDQGALWLVPERIRQLVSVAQGQARAVALKSVPEDVELESIAWLGDDRLAIGTEGECEPAGYAIAMVKVTGNAAHVVETLRLPVALWGPECNARRGLEAICHAGGHLIAAVEQPHEHAGQRVALLAHIDLASKAITPYRVALTSNKGKLAGLDCRLGTDAVAVLGIERHFKVANLIEFQVPLAPAAPGLQTLPAEAIADLYPHTGGGKRNFEGLVRLSDARIGVIVDNHYGELTGPNELLWLDLSPLQGSGPAASPTASEDPGR